ncbi:stalk domain-containing protein [Paenibacillus sp. MBLB4367]|uniref:stalk domain-containing protein n=1 Tax=Paenibacillus sp. MBLB4367 TaxID=3384767 RepID=UPI0039082A6F
MKQWIRVLLAFALLAAAVPGWVGEGSANAQSAGIEDPVLEQAIRKQLGIEDRELASKDLLKLTSLYPQEKEKIKSLKGLEQASNLQKLYLPGNEISDIKPLENLISLNFLALDGNEIEDICPISHLYRITKLVISENKIQNIDCLSQLYGLTDLLAGHNQISDIAALANLPLKWLILENNLVTDLTPLEWHRQLEHLYITGNRVEELGPLLAVPGLKGAYVDRNPLNAGAPSVLLKLEKQGVNVNGTKVVEKTAGIPVYFEGKKMTLDADPVIVEGSTLVPFRSLFEAFGLSVGWDDAAKTVTGSKESIRLQLQIGRATAEVNGSSRQLAAAPQLIGDYTYVPLRFVGEALGYEVVWDNAEKAVRLYASRQQVVAPDQKAEFEAGHVWKVEASPETHSLTLKNDPGDSELYYFRIDKKSAQKELGLKDDQMTLQHIAELTGAGASEEVVEVEAPQDIVVNGLKGIRQRHLLSINETIAIEIFDTILESGNDYYRLFLTVFAGGGASDTMVREYESIVSSFRATKSTEERFAAKFGGMKAEERISDAVRFYKELGFFGDKPSSADEAEKAAIERYKKEYEGKEWDPFDPNSGYSRFADLYVLEADSARVWMMDTENDTGEGNAVYETAIKQWAAISRGSFTPTEIKETWRSEDGPAIVEFMLNGKKRKLYPAYRGDFMDIGIIEDINAMIADTGYRFAVVSVDQTAFITVLTDKERKTIEVARMLPFDLLAE